MPKSRRNGMKKGGALSDRDWVDAAIAASSGDPVAEENYPSGPAPESAMDLVVEMRDEALGPYRQLDTEFSTKARIMPRTPNIQTNVSRLYGEMKVAQNKVDSLNNAMLWMGSTPAERIAKRQVNLNFAARGPMPPAMRGPNGPGPIQVMAPRQAMNSIPPIPIPMGPAVKWGGRSKRSVTRRGKKSKASRRR